MYKLDGGFQKINSVRSDKYQIDLYAGEKTSLRVIIQKDFKIVSLLKKVIPFASSGVSQLNRRNNLEGKTNPLPLPITVGLSIGVGNSGKFSGSQNKNLSVRIDLYDESWVYISSQIRHLKRKSERIVLSSGQKNGYAIVTLLNPNRRSITLKKRSRFFENLSQQKDDISIDSITVGATFNTGHEESDTPPDGMICTDWYMVTTDRATGQVVSEEFVGRSCYSNGGGTHNEPVTEIREEGVNMCEIRYMMDHAINAPSILANRRTVEAFINDYFPAGNFDGDSPENAIKHALYQAINTCTIGAFNTSRMAEFHEECDGVRAGTVQSFNMDTHNNNVGIQIGQDWQTNGCNLTNLVGAVLEAYQNGQLRKIDGSPTP